ncbi:MAG: hypothetical protein KJ063_10990 [Anaerolineae bacterium]|nr:hypothetical protein [Anaerolineae bacterium]
MPGFTHSTETIVVEIANMAVAMSVTDLDMAQRIKHTYHDFLNPQATPLITISIEVKPGALYIDPQPGNWIIESHYDRERLLFKSYQEYGELNLLTGQGYIEMAPDAYVENYLRVIYAWLCLKHESLLMHASGVIRNGLGYVFFGPSGSGKTTTSRLSIRQATILSDDLVIIRHQGEQYYLYGVPFKGEMSEAPRVNQAAPLQGIFRLRQDVRHYIEPMSRIIAVAEMAGSAPFINNIPTLNGKLLMTCNHVAKAVPIQQLHFRRDDGFWKVIDELYAPVP